MAPTAPPPPQRQQQDNDAEEGVVVAYLRRRRRRRRRPPQQRRDVLYALSQYRNPIPGSREPLEPIFRSLDPIFRDDEEVVLAAVRRHGSALCYASARLRNCRRVAIQAVVAGCHYTSFFGGSVFGYASEELRANRDVVLEAVYLDWRALQHASQELRNDKGVVLEAVIMDCRALQHASQELRNDKGVVLEAVKWDWNALQYASQELRNDKGVVLEAVKVDGEALWHASQELRNDKGIVMVAIGTSPLAIKCASEQLRKDRDVFIKAVRGCDFAAAEPRYQIPQLFKCIPDDAEALRADPLIIAAALSQREWWWSWDRRLSWLKVAVRSWNDRIGAVARELGHKPTAATKEKGPSESASAATNHSQPAFAGWLFKTSTPMGACACRIGPLFPSSMGNFARRWLSDVDETERLVNRFCAEARVPSGVVRELILAFHVRNERRCAREAAECAPVVEALLDLNARPQSDWYDLVSNDFSTPMPPLPPWVRQHVSYIGPWSGG